MRRFSPLHWGARNQWNRQVAPSTPMPPFLCLRRGKPLAGTLLCSLTCHFSPADDFCDLAFSNFPIAARAERSPSSCAASRVGP